MADEPKQGQEPTTTPTAPQEPDESAIRAAEEMLRGAGRYVLGQEDFGRLKGAATKEAEARAATLEAELKSLRSEHEQAAARIREIDDAGKSAAEKIAAQHAELKRRYEERERELAEARKAHQDSMERTKALMVDQRLAQLLTPTPDPELALLAARHRLGGTLTIDDAGRLVHEDAVGFQSVGPAADAVIQAWWAKQDTLRAPSMSPGPPTSGGQGTPAGEPEPFRPTGSFEEQLAQADAYDERVTAMQAQRR